MKPYHRLHINFVKQLAIVLTLLYSPLLWSEEYDATLLWSQKTGLGTVVSGIVEDVFVNVGDKVTKGERLVQLDASVFKGHVSEYRAKLESAAENLKEMERERDRALELYDRTVLSEHDLQMAKNDFVTAKAKYEKVRAGLLDKEFKLKYSAVRAPFDLVVLSRNAQPGQIIATEFEQVPLVVVAAADKMLARLFVSETELTQMKQGKSAKVKVGDKTYSGTIQSISLEPLAGKKETKSYPVDVEFNVQEVILRSGLKAKVIIE
jgi:RND family efflux transporter MFP subunit